MSVRLSVPSIDSGSDMQLLCVQLSIHSCWRQRSGCSQRGLLQWEVTGSARTGVSGSDPRRIESNQINDADLLLLLLKGKVSQYSITERSVTELIPVLGSQPAGDVSHNPGGRLPLLSATPAVTPATLIRGCYQFCCLVNRGTMGVNSLPKTVTRQRGDSDLNPGPSAPESSTLTTRLPSHPLLLLANTN